ncbi:MULTISPECIES: hypothetical protein [unclassified Tatumella]|uniref:hypothetical protein n=1 Tax=unclassified Tatumella TaxID=2649542 RepID=UPI001BB043EC|nr:MULTISPECIES: hypothetical protein [unclassified Tatumella]MBS0854951.1 hypothetical protein [Tatumella sp. JGM16]MBS0912087.1 hypothetical protein [Tatumella sp. JGM91]
MALVKILASNLFAGASLRKLEAGKTYDVDDSLADKWIAAGKAEKSTEKKGDKLVTTVSPANSTVTDSSAIQAKLDAALAQVSELTDAAAAKETEHAAALEAEKTRADTAEAALAEATKGK